MWNLALDLREMALLSALAQEPPTERSPLRRVCAAALQRPWGEILERSLPGFVERRMVLADDQGAPCLSPEWESVLAILHAPEQVASFGRQGSLAVGETIACRRGNLWALLALSRDADLLVLTCPLERAQMQGWFVQELCGGLAPGESALPVLSLDLALGELLILLGLQAVYRQRAASAAPLRGADLWVSGPELAALTPQALLELWGDQDAALPISAEALCEYVASDEHRQATATRLVQRGILWATRDSWALGEELRPWLDPGLVQDAISIQGAGDGGCAILLHILHDGCLRIEASPLSPLHVRLTGLPGAPDAEEWFEQLFPPVEEPAPEPEALAEEPGPEPEEEGAAPTCGRCGAELQPGQRFCGNCGAPTGAAEPTPEAPVCPECGVLVPAHARFCPECGALLTGLPE
jgi:hypothetical protein